MSHPHPPHPLSDLWRYVPGGFETRGLHRVLRFLGTACIHHGWHACLILRLSQWCHWLWLRPLSFILQRILLHLYGVDIHPSTPVGAGLWMPHPQNIVVHHKSRLGSEITLLHNVTVGGRGYEGYPTIADKACLYVGCSVLGGIRVGERAMVGAHALAIADVPDDAHVAGVPARQTHRSS